MAKEKYRVPRGVEHPGTGHWLPPGTVIELSDRQATILRLNGHITLVTEEKKATAPTRKFRP